VRAIAGATNATLSLTNVQVANVGSYTATISSGGVNLTSNAATLALLTGDSATHTVDGSGLGTWRDRL